MRTFISLLATGLLIWCVAMGVKGYVKAQDTNNVAREAFDEINQLRAGSNTPALIWDDELERLAIKHSQSMNDNNILKHSGLPYVENILEGTGTILGASAFSNGSQVVRPWELSYFHYMNMMDSKMTRGAIGIVGNYATFLASS